MKCPDTSRVFSIQIVRNTPRTQQAHDDFGHARVLSETSARADLCDVQTVNVGLEVHNEPARFDDQHSND